MLIWNRNPQPDNLPEIEIGNQLILHAERFFRYKVGADLITHDGVNIRVKVVDVFDRDIPAQITGGTILQLVGQILELTSANVFAVLKRPQAAV